MLEIAADLRGLGRQGAGGELGYVEELGRVGAADGCQGVLEHGVAEGAGGADGASPGGDKFFGANMGDALPGFFAQESEPSASPAAEAALVVARGFDQFRCALDDFPRLVVGVAVAAQIAGIVEDNAGGAFARSLGVRGE